MVQLCRNNKNKHLLIAPSSSGSNIILANISAMFFLLAKYMPSHQWRVTDRIRPDVETWGRLGPRIQVNAIWVTNEHVLSHSFCHKIIRPVAWELQEVACIGHEIVWPRNPL